MGLATLRSPAFFHTAANIRVSELCEWTGKALGWAKMTFWGTRRPSASSPWLLIWLIQKLSRASRCTGHFWEHCRRFIIEDGQTLKVCPRPPMWRRNCKPTLFLLCCKRKMKCACLQLWNILVSWNWLFSRLVLLQKSAIYTCYYVPVKNGSIRI